MIWCVEDDPSIREIEVYALHSTGLEARGFADGAEFWEALEKELPMMIMSLCSCAATRRMAFGMLPGKFSFGKPVCPVHHFSQILLLVLV